MANKTYISRRRWLNHKGSHDTGAIQYHVTADKGDGYKDIGATFSIWDCSRKINLNFSMYEKEEISNVASKINILIHELEEMRDALGQAWEDTFNE